MGSFTPHRPDVLGIEWAGLFEAQLPLSQGVERGQTLHSSIAETISGAAFPIASQSDRFYQFHSLATVYRKGYETSVGDIAVDRVSVNGGSVSGGASLGGGASSVVDALSAAGDNKRISFSATPGGYCDVQFATAGLFTGRRILKVEIETVILMSPVAAAGETLHLYDVRASGPGTNVTLFGDLPFDPSGDVSTIKTTGLGEINPFPPGADQDNDTHRYPWLVSDVQGFDGSLWSLRFIDEFATTANLYFVEMIVTHCVENRIAFGAQRFGNRSGGRQVSVPGEVVVDTITPSGAATWAKTAGTDYTVTLVSADGGGPFTQQFHISDTLAFGTTCLIPTLDAFDVFAPHEGRQAPRGRYNELVAAAADPRITPVVLLDGSVATSVDSMPYKDQYIPSIYAGSEAQQGIVQNAAAASTPYPFMRFYARIVGNPPGPLFLTDSATGATGGSITRTAFNALPDLTEPPNAQTSGWRLIELHVTPPILFDSSASVKKVRFSASGGDTGNYWQILGVEHFIGAATYGGTTAYVEDLTGTHTEADLAVAFGTDPPIIAGLRADVGFYNLALGDDCNTTAPGEFPVIAYAALQWTATAISNFDHYEIQRTDTFESVFRTIAEIHTQANASFFDFEWRVQRTSSYRIRVCRTDGFCGPWSATVSIVNQPSLYDHQFEFDFGTLILTSNAAPQMSMAVQAVYDDAVDPWSFPEAEAVQIERFFGRDYQAGFKPTERGGARFTRTVMLNPSRFSPKGHITDDAAFERLRDLAWADLPYVCVKNDLGERWLATIRVPEGTTRRRASAYLASHLRPAIVLAQLEVIEATVDPFPAEWNVFQSVPSAPVPDVEVAPTHGSVA